MADHPTHVVVVGAGLAGAHTCRELREQGYLGAITLVGAERHLPYDRPPLSKQVLLGEMSSSALDLDLDALDVTVSLGRRASGLRPGVLETDGGDVAGDGFVLATGSRPVRLPGGGGTVLRTIDDALALRAALLPGARVVVVGAGWIGGEVATAAARAGCRVTVLEGAPWPLLAPLGEEGRHVAGWYAAARAELRTGVSVAAVEDTRVVLADGEELGADVVLVGVGARPETGWLDASGLELDPGVVVDAHLATSWPGVVAVGDVASWWSGLYGRRVRVEHWDGALKSPAVAASTLLGIPAVHDPVPYFWSDQLGHFLQFAGYREGADATVHRGDPEGAAWSVCWLHEGRLVAVLAVDRPRDLVQGRRLIASRQPVDAERLADPAVPLASA